MKVHYSLPEDDHVTSFETPVDHNMLRPAEQDQLAEKAAEHAFSQSGCELGFPLIVAIHDGPDGKEVCRRMVEMDYEPTFYAYRIENK